MSSAKISNSLCTLFLFESKSPSCNRAVANACTHRIMRSIRHDSRQLCNSLMSRLPARKAISRHNKSWRLRATWKNDAKTGRSTGHSVIQRFNDPTISARRHANDDFLSPRTKIKVSLHNCATVTVAASETNNSTRRAASKPAALRLGVRRHGRRLFSARRAPASVLATNFGQRSARIATARNRGVIWRESSGTSFPIGIRVSRAQFYRVHSRSSTSSLGELASRRSQRPLLQQPLRFQWTYGHLACGTSFFSCQC